jgi:hypothetical protein
VGVGSLSNRIIEPVECVVKSLKSLGNFPSKTSSQGRETTAVMHTWCSAFRDASICREPNKSLRPL